MWKIAKYVMYDIARNKIILSYTAFLLAISLSLFLMDTDPSRSISSVLSVLFIVVPLVSIVFATVFFYNSYEFTELLAAQPIRRSHILLASFTGVSLSLVIAFLIGVAIPVALYAPTAAGAVLVVTGIVLSLVFTSLAFLAAVLTRDKARGIGMALLLWFYFSVVYDGLVLAFLFFFSDYPLEKPVLFITALNPIDLGRICVMLKMDIAALMGYTGALYRHFFGTSAGISYILLLMLLWIIVPLLAAVRIFQRKNL